MAVPSHVTGDEAVGRGRYRRLLLIISLVAVPWSVQVFSTGDVTFLFAWGLFNTNPPNVTTIWDFLLRFTMGLPDYILAWPLGVACYLVAVASAAFGAVTGREDVRLTAVALGLAGLTQLQLARGFSLQPNRVAWPLGTVVLWAVGGYLLYRYYAE